MTLYAQGWPVDQLWIWKFIKYKDSKSKIIGMQLVIIHSSHYVVLEINHQNQENELKIYTKCMHILDL